jgi:hypothetical protein
MLQLGRADQIAALGIVCPARLGFASGCVYLGTNARPQAVLDVAVEQIKPDWMYRGQHKKALLI